MSDSPPKFSLRTVTGHLGSSPAASPERTGSVPPTSAPGGGFPDLDLSDPNVETLPPFRTGSAEWGTSGPQSALLSNPSLNVVSSGPETGEMREAWQPADAALLALVTAAPSLPARAGREVLADDSELEEQAPGMLPIRPRRRWQRWDVAVGTILLLLVGYVLLAGGLYTFRLWQARQTNSVTLLQDLGHGGISQVTVLYEHNHLTVSEIDDNDPARVTILTVNEAIVLSTDKTVLEAWFQTVLQPGRLDLVIQIDGGLDWPPYHPQFTTILINNVAAIKTNPQAPGLRAPTTAELQQALRKLST